MTIRKSRQSTTQKVSRKFWDLLARIIKTENEISGGGVILRHKGVEYGATHISPEGVVSTYEGVTLRLSECTLRKGLL